VPRLGLVLRLPILAMNSGPSCARRDLASRACPTDSEDRAVTSAAPAVEPDHSVTSVVARGSMSRESASPMRRRNPGAVPAPLSGNNPLHKVGSAGPGQRSMSPRMNASTAS